MKRSEQQHGAFTTVLHRELRRMTSRRLYLAVCVILPLFCIAFMTTIFGNGQMERLPVGVVDMDFSATSRQLTRIVAATPTFNVKQIYTDNAAARGATQKKQIYGYLVIPLNFESDVLAGRQTALSYYYHYALLSVGCQIGDTFELLLSSYSTAPIVQTALLQGADLAAITNTRAPVGFQEHILFNPNLNYSIYLSQPFFYIMFQIIVLLVTVYIIGSEIRFGTAGDWLLAARGNILTAIAAKLLPYTVLFIVMGLGANYALFGLSEIPFSCGFWPLNLSMIIFILATQAMGVFVFSLFPALSIIISIVSMIGSLGATLSGVTFPLASMYRPVRAVAALLPVRHFVEINQNLLYGNREFAYMWVNVAILFLFMLLPLPLLPRLKRAIISRRYENIE